jgi:hypothetical protein
LKDPEGKNSVPNRWNTWFGHCDGDKELGQAQRLRWQRGGGRSSLDPGRNPHGYGIPRFFHGYRNILSAGKQVELLIFVKKVGSSSCHKSQIELLFFRTKLEISPRLPEPGV